MDSLFIPHLNITVGIGDIIKLRKDSMEIKGFRQCGPQSQEYTFICQDCQTKTRLKGDVEGWNSFGKYKKKDEERCANPYLNIHIIHTKHRDTFSVNKIMEI